MSGVRDRFLQDNGWKSSRLNRPLAVPVDEKRGMMDRRRRFYQPFKRDRASIADEHGPAFTISQGARILFVNEIFSSSSQRIQSVQWSSVTDGHVSRVIEITTTLIYTCEYKKNRHHASR